jgi:hypothetical protein
VSDLALPIPDDMLEALVARARQLGLIEEPRRRWAHIEGVAEYLGCEVSRVRSLRERGLPGDPVGKWLLFDLDEVDAMARTPARRGD